MPSPLEVAARITSLPGTMGANLILASPQEALLLEVSAHHRHVRVPMDGILTATNHYQSPGMQAFKGAAFRRPPLSPLDPFCFSQDYSLLRDQRLQELLRLGLWTSSKPNRYSAIRSWPILAMSTASSLTPPPPSFMWPRGWILLSPSGAVSATLPISSDPAPGLPNNLKAAGRKAATIFSYQFLIPLKLI